MKKVPYIHLGAGIILLAVLLYKPVKHLMMRPLAVHASWVEPRRKGRLDRSWELRVAAGQTARGQYGDSFVDDIEQGNEQKRRLFAIYRKGHGQMGISDRFNTVNGDPIFYWLLVEDGSARYVEDYTQDPRTSAAGVDIRPLKSLRLGFMRGGKFMEGEPAAADSPIIVLETEEQSGGWGAYY